MYLPPLALSGASAEVAVVGGRGRGKSKLEVEEAATCRQQINTFVFIHTVREPKVRDMLPVAPEVTPTNPTVVIQLK